jgi:hypothetical protein
LLILISLGRSGRVLQSIAGVVGILARMVIVLIPLSNYHQSVRLLLFRACQIMLQFKLSVKGVETIVSPHAVISSNLVWSKYLVS